MSPVHVCMLLYGDVEHDARVRREARALVEAGYRVTIATLANPGEARRDVPNIEGATVVPVPSGKAGGLLPGTPSPFLGETRARGGMGNRLLARLRWLVGYARSYAAWVAEAERRLPPADVWHGHDLPGLWAAGRLRSRHGGAVVYDSHELYLEAGSVARLPRPAKAVLALFEGRSARGAAGVITVNPSIARELERRYRVRPVVVMNCPRLVAEPPGYALRARLDLGDRPVALYHGAMSPGRGIEQLVEILPRLGPDVAVVLLGNGSLREPYASQALDPPWKGRLFVHPAVPVDALRDWVGDADVGVILFQPIDRNNVLGTPNKLFEYFEAGVPVVVSDFPEMHGIVTATGAGVTCDPSDPAAIAAAVRSILEAPAEVRAARRAAARHAAETTYNWETQSAGLLTIYAALAARIKGGSTARDRVS